MKTKDKVKYWLDKYPSLKDDDNRLSANIWSEELGGADITAQDFLALYAGEKYNLRKGILQDKWRKELGYER